MGGSNEAVKGNCVQLVIKSSPAAAVKPCQENFFTENSNSAGIFVQLDCV
jgi:hypothetical protein